MPSAVTSDAVHIAAVAALEAEEEQQHTQTTRQQSIVTGFKSRKKKFSATYPTHVQCLFCFCCWTAKGLKGLLTSRTTIDLGLAVVIGDQFSVFVNAIVSYVVAPIFFALAQPQNIRVSLGPGFIALTNPVNASFNSASEAVEAGALVLNFLAFLEELIAFLILMITVYWCVNVLRHWQREKDDVLHKMKLAEEENASKRELSGKKQCQYCCSFVPNEATRCMYCTSHIATSTSSDSKQNVNIKSEEPGREEQAAEKRVRFADPVDVVEDYQIDEEVKQSSYEERPHLISLDSESTLTSASQEDLVLHQQQLMMQQLADALELAARLSANLNVNLRRNSVDE